MRKGKSQNRPEDDEPNRVDDISIVVVDYNNIPQDVAKIVNTDHSRTYKLGSARSSARGSFLANNDFSNIPLPS